MPIPYIHPIPISSFLSPSYTENTNLVGAMINAKNGCGFSHKLCKIGKLNAAVLPLPVCAKPIISRPSSAEGIDSTWIGVGFLNPRVVHDAHSSGIIPREENVWVVVSIPSGWSGEVDRVWSDEPDAKGRISSSSEGEGEREGPAELDCGDDILGKGAVQCCNSAREAARDRF
jgi:hypothetical protein